MTRVTEEQVDQLIEQSTIQSIKMGQKTTVVHLILPNGFEIVGAAACVDPAEYDHEIGEKIALGRIKDKVWLLEGYLLQNKDVSSAEGRA
jgi:hypothetical protein